MLRVLLLTAVLLVSVVPSHARGDSGAEAQVLHDFEVILDLWRDGRYDLLYERTTWTGSASREQFGRRLALAPRHPSCCWEKMQEARVTMKGERSAIVRARLGFEGGVSGTEYVTKGIKLKKENDVWVISQADLFSLGNLSKKRTRVRYVPIK